MTEELKRIISELFPDWTLSEHIGNGSCGSVWRMVQVSAGIPQFAALKIIPAQQTDPESAEQEYAVAKHLNSCSENICNAIERKHSADNQYHFILMPLLKLPNIPYDSDSVPLTIKMGLHVLKALKAISSEGYAHLDIKPSNILCNNGTGFNQTFLLCDFGLAKKIRIGDHIQAGTPDYMSPEMYHGGLPSDKQALIRSDLYSLGMTLYYYLNDRLLPYQDWNTDAAAALALRMEPDPKKRRPLPPPLHLKPDDSTPGRLPVPDGVKTRLWDFLRKLLAFDPSKRYQTIDETLEELSTIGNCFPAHSPFLDLQVSFFSGDTVDDSRERIPTRYMLKKCGLRPLPYPVSENRSAEIRAICRGLAHREIPLVNGIAGIGKTEVAIAALNTIKDSSGIFLIHFKDSMRQTILNLEFVDYPFVPKGSALTVGQIEQERYDNRMEVLKKYYTNSILLIDNFDSAKSLDQMLDEPECQELCYDIPGLRLVFTTRFSNAENQSYLIEPLSPEALKKLIRYYAPHRNFSEEELSEAIEAVNAHTLTLVLIAKSLNDSPSLSLRQILDALHRGGDAADKLPKVSGNYNRSHEEKTILAHLLTLFDITGLEEEAVRVMSYATLLPDEGMAEAVFTAALSPEQEQQMIRLTSRGWLERIDTPEATIRMHPIIRDTFVKQLPPEKVSFTPFLDRLSPQIRADTSEELLAAAATVFANGALFASSDSIEAKESRHSFAASLFLRAEKYQQAIVQDLFCLPRLGGSDWSPVACRALTENPAYACKEQEQKELSRYIIDKFDLLNYFHDGPSVSAEHAHELFTSENYFDCLGECNTILHQLRNRQQKTELLCSTLAAIYARIGINRTAAAYILEGLSLCAQARANSAASDMTVYRENGFLSVMADLWENAGNVEKQLDYQLAALRHLKNQLGDFRLSEISGKSYVEMLFAERCAQAGLLLCERKRYSEAAELLSNAEEALREIAPFFSEIDLPQLTELKAKLETRQS